MMRWLALMSLGLIGLSCFAQDETKVQKNDGLKTFYKLDFEVQEVDNGHVVNSRNYSLIASSNVPIKASLRAGEQVPFVIGSLSAAKGGQTVPNYQMEDTGVEIDCQKIEETANQLSLWVRANITSLADVSGAVSSIAPITRRNQWESIVVLPLRHPTILFSSDDPASKRTMRLQLTVTPIS